MFRALFPTGENNIIMQASIAIMLLPGKESSPAVPFRKILLLLLEIVVSKSWLDGMWQHLSVEHMLDLVKDDDSGSSTSECYHILKHL